MTTTTTRTATGGDNPYFASKHGFEPLPNDSVTCRWCRRSFTNDLHCNVPQPSDPAEPRQWRYEKFERDGLFGFRIVDGNGVWLWESYPQPRLMRVSEEVAAVTVRCVKSHAALVAALEQMLEIVEDEGHASNYVPQCAQAREALRQAATIPAAGDSGPRSRRR